MKAYELLSQPGAWTQGYSAVDVEGSVTNPRAQDACRWCLFGAILRCYPKRDTRDIMELLNQSVFCHSAIAWNDAPGRTQAEVVALLKELDL